MKIGKCSSCCQRWQANSQEDFFCARQRNNHQEIKKHSFKRDTIILAVEDDNYLQEPLSLHWFIYFLTNRVNLKKQMRDKRCIKALINSHFLTLSDQFVFILFYNFILTPAAIKDLNCNAGES